MEGGRYRAFDDDVPPLRVRLDAHEAPSEISIPRSKPSDANRRLLGRVPARSRRLLPHRLNQLRPTRTRLVHALAHPVRRHARPESRHHQLARILWLAEQPAPMRLPRRDQPSSRNRPMGASLKTRVLHSHLLLSRSRSARRDSRRAFSVAQSHLDAKGRAARCPSRLLRLRRPLEGSHEQRGPRQVCNFEHQDMSRPCRDTQSFGSGLAPASLVLQVQ